MIPKVIHQIWIGPKPTPEAAMNTWRHHHPDWEYHFWNEQTIDFPLRNQAQYEGMGNLGGKADILRYEILHRYGGIYLDADLTCLKPLDISFLEHDFFAAYESELWRPELVANGVLGAIPGHPIMETMVRNIGELNPVDLRESQPAIDTGPFALTDVLSQFVGPVKIYPSHYFYPEHFQDAFSRPEHFYASHDWYSDFPTLALAMVVDGHAFDLWRSLPRFQPHITRFSIAVTDKCGPECRQAIESIFGDLPGEILNVGDVSQGEAWSTVLEFLHGKADYSLLSEPNAVLYDFRRNQLTVDADSFTIPQHCGSDRSPAVRIVRSDEGWAFSQEGLQSIHRKGQKREIAHLNQCHMFRFDPGPENARRLQGEESILLGELDRRPKDPDSLFYLGQFYEDTGDLKTAADYYGRRAEIDEFPEQTWEACWRAALCHRMIDSQWPLVEQALMEAHRIQPSRPEPLFELGLKYISEKDFGRATELLIQAASLPLSVRPFRSDPLIRQKALEQLNISAYYVGKYSEGLRAGLEALQAATTVLPRAQILANLEHYLDRVDIRSIENLPQEIDPAKG